MSLSAPLHPFTLRGNWTEISVLVLTACKDSATNSASPSPSPTPVSAAQAEFEFQLLGDLDSSVRVEARRTAAEFIASKLPTWKVKGLSSQIYHDNIVWVAVDIEKDGKGGVLNLSVRRFFPESGEPYWKASLLDKTLQQQLHAMADADLWKRLDDTKEELENLRNPPEREDSEPNDPR